MTARSIYMVLVFILQYQLILGRETDTYFEDQDSRCTFLRTEKLLPILHPSRKDALGIQRYPKLTVPSLICLAILLCLNFATNQPNHGSHIARYRSESHPLGTAISSMGVSQ